MPLRAQSLAELAKKEEERRKGVPEPAKVYTNKDLTAVPGGTPAASVPAPAADAGTAPQAADSAPKDGDASKDKPAGQVKDQAYWAKRLKTLQEKLEREQTYVEAIQTRVNASRPTSSTATIQFSEPGSSATARRRWRRWTG